MPVEIEVLLELIKGVWTEGRPDLVGVSPDWGYVLGQGRRHQLLPLLYWQLKEQSLPAEVKEHLYRAFLANVGQTAHLTAELAQVLALLAGAEVATRVIKGPVLNRLVYGDMPVRQFADLDLLVREEDLPRAYHLLLEEAGFVPEFALNEAELQRHLRLYYGVTLTHPTKGYSLDLHWSLLPPHFSFSPSAALFWAKSQTVWVDGLAIPTLSNEALVLFLCGHAAKDNWASLKGICDLAGMLYRYPALDWEWLEEQAGHLGSRRMFWLGLNLARQLLGAPVPAKIARQLETDPEVEALTAKVCRLLFWPSAGNFAWLVKDNVYVASMERWQDRLWYWVNMVFVPAPPDWLMVRLPAKLYGLYYPLRLARLGKKYLFGG